MTVDRLAPPGPQLAVGRIRVDAARAIAKLRDYQLANPMAWVLEAIRAAVASGATAIELRGDASNVWVSWAGEPWARDDLPQLFDELVSPHAAADRQHVRLAAAAVNSALGTAPDYVDVIAVAGARSACRARYTPDVLGEETTELGDAAAARAIVDDIVAPPGAPVGMMIHLHRPLSFAAVRGLFFTTEPEELVLARAACDDLAVPLRIGDTVLGRAEHTGDVLRIPLGDGLAGWLAVVDPGAVGTTAAQVSVVEIAEHGVVLVRYALDVELGYAVARGPVPLRVFIDGDRMPTNVSRSQVRRDQHPVSTAMARAPDLVPVAIEALRVQLAAAAAPHAAGPARTAALALIGAAIAIPQWTAEIAALTGPLRALADLPLLCDATGAPHPVSAGWSGLVHAGPRPADAVLAPWLGEVAWMPPGDAARALLGPAVIDARAARRRIRWARRQYKAERAFFAHAVRVPVVDGDEVPRLRMTLGAALPGSCVPDAVFDGLAGEIVLYSDERDGGPPPPSELVVLWRGRELDQLIVDSPTRFAAVIDSPTLTPGDGYHGIVRNPHYWIVDRAMRAGVLRAIEALVVALGGGGLPRGFAQPEPAAADPDADARLVRNGLALAYALGEPIGTLLADRPAWPTRAGGYVSHAELAAQPERRAIGVASPHDDVAEVPGRLMIVAGAVERELLARLLPAHRLVAYSGARSTAPTALALATQLARTTGLALALDRDPDGVVAAIALGGGRITMRHVGVALRSEAYVAHYGPCTIELDAPALVPDDEWHAIADDHGFAPRDFRQWERALLRAIARVMVGAGEPHLIDGEGRPVARIAITGEVGAMWCAAIAGAWAEGAVAVLGKELVAQLRACPLFQMRGKPGVHSIDDLIARSAAVAPAALAPSLWYVDADGDANADVPAVIANQVTARAIGALASCAIGEATLAIRRSRDATLRAERLAVHRAQRIAALALPAAEPELPTVPLASSRWPGLVGITRHSCAIAVSIEGRAFATLGERALGVALPLVAAIDLPADAADATFEAIQPELVGTIRVKVLATVPVLIGAIAAARPSALAAPGSTRKLLVTWLRGHPLPAELRGVLRAAPAFATVRGDRVAIDIAAEPHGVVSCAAWHEAWQAPDPGATSSLDGPILELAAGDDELAELIDALGDSRADVTIELERVQYARRAARGLIAAPTLSNVPPAFKRSLTALGGAGRSLGLGEIGLVDVDRSTALLYTRGAMVASVELDVTPPVTMVVEGDELVERPAGGSALSQLMADLSETGLHDRLRAPVQELAIALVRALAAESPLPVLQPALARRLFAAALTGAIAGSDLGALPVVEGLDGRWTTWTEVADQLARFANLWLAPADTPADAAPLDEHRRVFRMPRLTGRRTANAVPHLDAILELAYDDATRRNRVRPPATSLVVPAGHGVLAMIDLPGDGVTAPRGQVAVLAPHGAAARRELRAHRALHPFEPIEDPCAWPTIAVVDDARLTPSRTWAHAEPNAAWAELVRVVQDASERALATAITPPPDAVVVEPITHDADAPALHVRGALWLMPIRRGQPTTITLTTARATAAIASARVGSFGGALIAYTAEGQGPPSPTAIDAVCLGAHRRLVHAAIRGRVPDMAAHVAYALAVGHIVPAEAGTTRFACFVPAPLDASALVALLESDTTVAVYDQAPADGSGGGMVDDGGALATIVLAALGARATRSAAPRPAERGATTGHVLAPLATALHDRLVAIGAGRHAIAIANRREPIATYDDCTLWLAGDNARLHAVANALAVGSPWAQDALDAVAAHAACVLDLGMSDVTHSTQLRALAALLHAQRA